jgi:hypothetical protein
MALPHQNPAITVSIPKVVEKNNFGHRGPRQTNEGQQTCNILSAKPHFLFS